MRGTKTLVSRITATSLFALVLLPLAATTADAAAPKATAPKVRALSVDALVQRSVSEIDAWAVWLKANNATGFVGEVGWPSDDPRWNTLADAWFKRANAAGVGVTTWVSGEWAAGQQLGGYVRESLADKSVNTARSNAVLAESHFAKSSAPRGVNMTGPEMGSAANQPTSTFSNQNVGVLDQTYHYDSAASYQYLASRGVRTVRMPFRWERVQRTPFGPLDADEMGRLKTSVHAARGAGLQVILDLHNFGSYYLADASGRGVRRTIGSPELPIPAFTDVWAKIANYFAGDDAVYAFGLMNEPVDLKARGKTAPARVWEQASQQAVNVIRATGDTRTIMVAGYQWSGITNWALHHPTSWIKDPANSFQYEAHQYFDARRSGVYRSYDVELAAVAAS